MNESRAPLTRLVPAEPVLLRLFGGCILHKDGRETSLISRPKLAALLAYIGAQDTAFPRGHLAALLWPDQPRDAALGNLRMALMTLRRLLPAELDSALCSTRHEVHWKEASVDVRRFEHARHSGALEGASEYYEGDFLDGLALSDCEEYAAWLESQRKHYHEEGLKVFDGLVDALEARDKPEQALHAALRAARMAPLSDRHCQSVMRLLARLGRAGDAQVHYGAFAARLDAELGSRPDPATRALAHAIKEGHKDTASLPPHRLPGDTHPVPTPVETCAVLDELARIEALSRQHLPHALLALDRLDKALHDAPPPEREHSALQARLLRARLLIGQEGHASASVRACFIDARQRARRLNDEQGLFAATWGLWLGAPHQSEALVLAGELAGQAEQLGQLTAIGCAELAFGVTQFWMGRFEDAATRLRAALEMSRHLSPPDARTPLGDDLPAAAGSFLGWCLGLRGWLGQAEREAEQAIHRARQVGDVQNLCLTLGLCSTVTRLIHNERRLAGQLDEMQTLAQEAGFDNWLNLVALIGAWRHAARGDARPVLDLLQNYDLPKALTSPFAVTTLSDMVEIAGMSAEHTHLLRLCEEGLRASMRSGISFFDAEFHRWAGLALHAMSRRHEAMTRLDMALGVARAQGATLFELRAARDLARIAPARNDALRAVLAALPLEARGPDVDEARALATCA